MKSKADNALFFKKKGEKLIILLIYVDDITLTWTNGERLVRIKELLHKPFYIKELRKLCYFLGIEIAHSNKGLFLYQMKYTLDLLKCIGMVGSKPLETPVELGHKIWNNPDELMVMKTSIDGEKIDIFNYH